MSLSPQDNILIVKSEYISMHNRTNHTYVFIIVVHTIKN